MPFRPGMSATVDINTHTERNIITIPIQAVTTREKEKSEDAKNTTSKTDDIEEVVFLFIADTASMVNVTTGIQDNEYIQVLSGLEVDQEVIIGPYSTVSRKLKNGLALERKKKKDGEKDETKIVID
jgi:HlyD family secretion protein